MVQTIISSKVDRTYMPTAVAKPGEFTMFCGSCSTLVAPSLRETNALLCCGDFPVKQKAGLTRLTDAGSQL